MSFIGKIFSKLFNHGNQCSTSNTTSNKPLPVTTPVYAPRGGWLDATVDDSSSTAATVEIYDLEGHPLRLGAANELGAGGEGIAYELPLNPNILVKMYRQGTLEDPQKIGMLRQRILDMVNLVPCAKMSFLAWPLMPVMDARREVIGFAMRKCTGFSFQTLRGPRFIKKRFPTWTRRELALTAIDFLKKLQLMAACNVLVNDFNPANFLVNQRGEVSFIDCDSFQVPGRGRVNVSRTYFASHVAPELLKDKRLLAVPRNLHHVEFAAALTVFNLLMCGLHPYSWYDPWHKSACGTPEDNLLQGRCPLGTGSNCKLPKGAWFNLWSWLPFRLKGVFITMFKDGHDDPAVRPSLAALQNEVETFLQLMGTEPERASLEPRVPNPLKIKGGYNK